MLKVYDKNFVETNRMTDAKGIAKLMQKQASRAKEKVRLGTIAFINLKKKTT